MFHRVKEKLNSGKGFTLSEVLMSVLILVILGVAMTSAITASIHTYKDSLYISESRSVADTLNDAIADSLRFSAYNSIDEGSDDVLHYTVGKKAHSISVKGGHVYVDDTDILNDKAYAGMSVSNMQFAYENKVYTFDYTISGAGNSTEHIQYSVRTLAFDVSGAIGGIVDPVPSDQPIPYPEPTGPEIKKVAVRFVMNGYTPQVETMIVEKGKTIPNPATIYASLAGVDWYLDEARTQSVTFPLTVNSNMTLYAGKLCKITITVNNTTWGTVSKSVMYVATNSTLDVINNTLKGSEELVTATSNGKNYLFDYWRIDLVPHKSGDEITVTHDMHAEAMFYDDKYTGDYRIYFYYQNKHVDDFHKDVSKNTKLQDKGVMPNDPSVPGYEFGGWFLDPTFTVPLDEWHRKHPIHSDQYLYAKLTPINVNYTVAHYLQNTDGSTYPSTPVYSETRSGLTDTMTKVVPDKTYEGFTVQPIEQENINGDESTIVKILYKRNTHKITIKYQSEYTDLAGNLRHDPIYKFNNGYVLTRVVDPNKAEVSYDVLFGTDYTVPNLSSITGYAKNDPIRKAYKTVSEQTEVSINSGKITMPDFDVTVCYTYYPTEYNLKICGQNAKFVVTIDGCDTPNSPYYISEGGYSSSIEVLDTSVKAHYGSSIKIKADEFYAWNKRIGIGNYSDAPSGMPTKFGFNLFNDDVSSKEFAVSRSLAIAAGSSDWCLAEGTLITLSDGSQKPIEDITPQDEVLVFNHERGKLDVSHIMVDAHFNDSVPRLANIMHLVFDNGTEVRVINVHGFFDSTLNKYVNLSAVNYKDYIGDAFYTASGETTKLTDVYFTEEETGVYAPVTEKHLNLFADGILSMTSLTEREEGLFTFFELDADMKYDRSKVEEDIAKYGLYSYEDFEPYGISQELFDYLPAQYLKVAEGKGLITFDEMLYLVDKYVDVNAFTD